MLTNGRCHVCGAPRGPAVPGDWPASLTLTIASCNRVQPPDWCSSRAGQQRYRSTCCRRGASSAGSRSPDSPRDASSCPGLHKYARGSQWAMPSNGLRSRLTFTATDQSGWRALVEHRAHPPDWCVSQGRFSARIKPLGRRIERRKGKKPDTLSRLTKC
jgi:hypothetical protein